MVYMSGEWAMGNKAEIMLLGYAEGIREPLSYFLSFFSLHDVQDAVVLAGKIWQNVTNIVI